MKCFLSTGAFVTSVVMLLILAPGPSVTVETKAIATSSDEPIKVLDLKLKTSTANKATRVDGLEMEIQNTSGKPIQYVVVHAVIPGSGSPLRIPLKFGHAPVPNARSGRVEILRPGAKVGLQAAKGLTDRITAQIASGRVPSSKDIEAKINIVIFEDKSAWAGGELLYPDLANRHRWNTATELARNSSVNGEVFGINYSKASYKASANTCYRFTHLTMFYCCDDPNGPLYVANFNFTGDPNGRVQPNTVESCCPQGSGCCFHDESTGCS